MTKTKIRSKRVGRSFLDGYCFENEKGNDVTVLATKGDWCMVEEVGKKKPYVLEKEFVLAIWSGGSLE